MVKPTESYTWQNLTTGQSLGGGQTLDLATVSLVGNDTIECTVTVTDGDDATDSSIATVIVQNTPPIVSNVQITPNNPLNDRELTCSATVVDPEGDPVTTTYQWETGTGTVLGTGTTIDLSQTSVMPTDVVSCVVSSTDTSNATGTGQASVTVANRDPVLSQTTIAPSPAYNDSTLTCSSVASDLDGQTVTLSYAWQDSSGNIVGNTDTGFDHIGRRATCRRIYMCRDWKRWCGHRKRYDHHNIGQSIANDWICDHYSRTRHPYRMF